MLDSGSRGQKKLPEDAAMPGALSIRCYLNIHWGIVEHKTQSVDSLNYNSWLTTCFCPAFGLHNADKALLWQVSQSDDRQTWSKTLRPSSLRTRAALVSKGRVFGGFRLRPNRNLGTGLILSYIVVSIRITVSR
jgi:hypothetical protein